MALLERLPSRVLTVRGWGFVLAAVVALLAAQTLGRRDLLYVGILLLALPLASLLVLRVLKPRFTVARHFHPESMEVGATTTVTLELTASVAGGARIAMEEHLPARFGDAPRFSYPAVAPTREGVSHYEYRLRCATRGVFAIGPITAEFMDPFGLVTSRHVLGGTADLVVTPAPVELLGSVLSGSRGADGLASTRRQANPSDDDVMTRQYRHGDSMRRVHWAATARHDELMVRQEESVTTPQATLLMDQRHHSFSTGFGPAFGSGETGAGLSTSPTFEWAVTAVMSISAHLLERNYAVRFLEQQGAPALLRSASAPSPSDEEHHGAGAVTGIAEGLAALELAPENGRHTHGEQRSGSTAVRAVAKDRSLRSTGRPSPGTSQGPPAAFGDQLLDGLVSTRHRGPLIAVLGVLSDHDAQALAGVVDHGSVSYAVIVTERPADARRPLKILRNAGWHATAVSPAAALPVVWAGLDRAAADPLRNDTAGSARPIREGSP